MHLLILMSSFDQDQANCNYCTEKDGDSKVLPLLDELLAVDDCWKRKKSFFKVVTSDEIPMSHTPMYIWIYS